MQARQIGSRPFILPLVWVLALVVSLMNGCMASEPLDPNRPVLTPAQIVTARLDQGATAVEQLTVRVITLHSLEVLSTANTDAILSTLNQIAEGGERAVELTRTTYVTGGDFSEFDGIVSSMSAITTGLIVQIQGMDSAPPELLPFLIVINASFQFADAFTEGFHAR